MSQLNSILYRYREFPEIQNQIKDLINMFSRWEFVLKNDLEGLRANLYSIQSRGREKLYDHYNPKDIKRADELLMEVFRVYLSEFSAFKKDFH